MAGYCYSQKRKTKMLLEGKYRAIINLPVHAQWVQLMRNVIRKLETVCDTTLFN